jgi:hypothetical protein
LFGEIVVKIKKELIHKAKVKKAYAKVKAKEQESRNDVEPSSPEGDKTEGRNDMHPDRIALLNDEDQSGSPEPSLSRGPRRPPPAASHEGATAKQKRFHGDNDRLEYRDEEAGSRADDGRSRNIARKVDDDEVEVDSDSKPGHRRSKSRRPGYFDKELAEGGRKRHTADSRREEADRRAEARNSKMAERQRFKKKSREAHMYHANGQKKLGRESAFLLEKVRRMMGSK